MGLYILTVVYACAELNLSRTFASDRKQFSVNQ